MSATTLSDVRTSPTRPTGANVAAECSAVPRALGAGQNRTSVSAPTTTPQTSDGAPRKLSAVNPTMPISDPIRSNR